jgi:hypothetical protein
MDGKNNYKTINQCRICGSRDLSSLFSLGEIYVSTFVTLPGEDIGKAPLELTWCEKCTLVQLRDTAPQELMYSGIYWYESGLNKTIVDNLKETVRIASNMVAIREGDIVLDIGANDGTLLGFYPKKVVKVGCEPASNLQSKLKKRADVVINDFWNYHLFEKDFGKRKVKIITAMGMFYDMDNPGQFIMDSSLALDKDGIFIAQLMTAKQMLQKNDVGNICHEHLEYYSYNSLKHLFDRNGLEIFKVEENDINGGSYRLFARPFRSGSIDYPENINKGAYLDFFRRIEKNKEDCVSLVSRLTGKGEKVYGYGASTKGNTILQYYELNRDLIKGIAEIHPDKIGKYTVGTNIPIVNEDEARTNADYFLVLPFAFRDDFINREREWLRRGGKFIFSTPKTEIYPEPNN